MPAEPFQAARVAGRARLVLLRGAGGDGSTYYLNATEHVAGRDAGAILFPDDPTVSPEHANFHYTNGRLYVMDLDSANGTYIRLRGEVPLEHGDRFVCGEQMFEFRRVPEVVNQWVEDTCMAGSPAPEGGEYQLVQVLAGNRPGLLRTFAGVSTTLGREGCTLSFPTDRFMSHEHSRVRRSGEHWVLEDAGSKNGTYYRIRDAVGLQDGDTLFLGKQLLRVEID